jgi:hypothetical protein
MMTKMKYSAAASALILGAFGVGSSNAGEPAWTSVSANIKTSSLMQDYWYAVNGGVGGPVGVLHGAGAALNTNLGGCLLSCFFNIVWLDNTYGANARFALQTPLGHYVTAINGGGMGGPNDATSPIHTDTYPSPVYADNVFTIYNLGNDRVMLQTVNGDIVYAVDDVGGNDPQNLMPFHTNATAIGTWETFYLTNPTNFVYPSSTSSSSNSSTPGGVNISADFTISPYANSDYNAGSASFPGTMKFSGTQVSGTACFSDGNPACGTTVFDDTTLMVTWDGAVQPYGPQQTGYVQGTASTGLKLTPGVWDITVTLTSQGYGTQTLSCPALTITAGTTAALSLGVITSGCH